MESAEQTQQLIDRILAAIADAGDPAARDIQRGELHPADLGENIDPQEEDPRVA